MSTSPHVTLGGFTKRELAWSFYDFSNSAYALLITGVGYQLYFKSVVCAGCKEFADFIWGASVAVSIFLSAILSPPVGRLADTRGWRKGLFVGTTLLAVFGTCMLGLGDRGWFVVGLLAFVVTNCAYNMALFLYDSYLGLVTSESRIGRVSGFGWGWGYVGGIVCLALTFPLFSKPLSAADAVSFRWGFVAVGAFYLIFSLPAFVQLPSRGGEARSDSLENAWQGVWQTLKDWRDHRKAFRFILSYWFISEAIMTVIYFTANFLSSTYGMKPKEILLLTVLVQGIAFPTTWLIGLVGDNLNLCRMYLGSIAIWVLIVVCMALFRDGFVLYIILACLGFVIGSTQALARAVLTKLIPKGRISEFFGFNSLSSKVAATVGPLVFGAVSSFSGSQRAAWLSLLPFLVIGALLIDRNVTEMPNQSAEG